MVNRFINDLKRLLAGRDIRLLDGVLDIDSRDSLDHVILLTVFGESVEIIDGDFGEFTTLCYSKERLIREMYDILDNEKALYLSNESLVGFACSISLYWDRSSRNWVIDCDDAILQILGISTDVYTGGSEYELYLEIIEKIDVEALRIINILRDIYRGTTLLMHCRVNVSKVPDGYCIRSNGRNDPSCNVIFDGKGIIVKDAKEMELMKEMYSL